MSEVPQDEVLRLYREGVDAFTRFARELSGEEWERRACGDWSAVVLTRHVAAVAGWYHEWLDRAERGDATPPFRGTELAAQNELALVPLAEASGPGALELFVTRATSYAARLPAAWDLPYGYPRGTVTAGLHAAVAATEWHLHTWDLARSGGAGHRPSDPDALYRGAGACLAKAQGGLKGRIAAILVPVGARLSPWEALLRRSGRAPGPED
ncbi:MAG TPA: maleylpyruvate isomerase N-terminal domain-containing protein [Acidimicrobiales bacterium]|nr:maleylpyruvate isomerase N-terminal domain-containing protein [Acidimicrobiales bacterium]